MSFLSNIAGAVLNFGTGIYNSERNRSAANATRDWNKHMWKLETEYNTPANQRQRLVDAGLNPALMYQTMPQNTASAPTTGAQAHTDVKFDPNSVLMMANLEAIKAQTDNTRADAQRKWFDLEREKLANAELRTTGMELDNAGKATANDIAAVERSYREESLILKNKGFDLNNKQTQTFIEQMTPRFAKEMQKMTAEIANIRQNTQTSRSQQQNINVDTIIKRYEQQARSEGWSYSDNAILRQIIGLFGSSGNQANRQTGKGHYSNTLVAKAIATIFQALFQ